MAEVWTITLNPALKLSVGLDALASGQVQRAREGHTTAAGKGNNVACVLAAHGHTVTVTGFLGHDNAGLFESAFAAWGVRDALIRVPGETRTNVKLAETSGRVTDINLAGMVVEAPAWAALCEHI